MSVTVANTPQVEDVGEILVKVQEDLQHLKSLVSRGDGVVDIASVEAAIQRTEDGIKHKTEQLLYQLNNRVLTLPTLDREVSGGQDLWPTNAQSRNVSASTYTQVVPLGQNTASWKAPPGVAGEIQMAGPTPGQKMKTSRQTRALDNPYNSRNREAIQDNYGVQLPLISQRPMVPDQSLKVMKGSTVERLAVLPRANRVDPQLLPPPISESDTKKGILNLMERGLIPPAAELTLDPSPVDHRVAPLHEPGDKEKNKHITGDSLAMYKVDHHQPAPPATDAHTTASGEKPKKVPPPSKVGTGSRQTSAVSSQAQSAHKKQRGTVTVTTLEMPRHPLPPPTTPASAPDFKERQHRFAIQHGRIRENSQEYQAFRNHYCLSWGSIVSMLRHLEKMLTNYSVPIAFINGDKLADLSLEFELDISPTIQDLLSVVVNREDVENIIMRPGRRYMGPNGRNMAAAKIQATFKMYQQHTAYVEYRRKKWAAGIIAITWIMHVKMAKVRKQLKQTRREQLDRFRQRIQKLSKNWERIQSSKRVILHIPSLGYDQKLRETMLDFNTYQNLQMGRICDIKDPNVDVIYVSPVPITEDMSQYYNKLVGLKDAIDTGDVDNQQDISSRYKILTPEALKSFPGHQMCLSTVLKYSPRTLKRIKNLIRGRDTYIITGRPHHDDIFLSDYLDVPVLSAEPEIAQLYSTKSGAKRVFASANVAVPPSEYDVYSLPQLHECLAQLITENLEVTRWLFKLDEEFNGRGIAYLDVAEILPCYPWALKEALRYGEKWSKKWAQEAAYIKIHAEIPEVLANNAVPCDQKVYATWEIFLDAFLSHGGVIEACPPSESVTALTVDMFISPDGRGSLVCNGDQIHADSPFCCWGLSIPQSSVEPAVLNDACQQILEACKTRGALGHLSIDFVTFIHPKTMRQELWATDLDLGYTDSHAMFTLFTFTTCGTLNPDTHYFDIPPPKKQEKKMRRRRLQTEDETPPNTNRFAVLSTRLRHTNLSVVHYSVFFQMCRAHGIGYDIKEKQGTVFTLIDGYERDLLGMVAVSDTLQGALATFARNLSIIHQEISAPNMQGDSNFKPVIEDIEAILGTTIQNSVEQTDIDPNPPQ